MSYEKIEKRVRFDIDIGGVVRSASFTPRAKSVLTQQKKYLCRKSWHGHGRTEIAHGIGGSLFAGRVSTFTPVCLLFTDFVFWV